MDKLWTERNELLRYALQNPPKNVDILYPAQRGGLDALDLSLCPSPIPLYTQALRSAAGEGKAGKSKRSFLTQLKRVKRFTFDLRHLPSQRAAVAETRPGVGSAVQDVPAVAVTMAAAPHITAVSPPDYSVANGSVLGAGRTVGTEPQSPMQASIAVNLTPQLTPQVGNAMVPYTAPTTSSSALAEPGVLSQMVHYFLNRLNSEPLVASGLHRAKLLASPPHPSSSTRRRHTVERGVGETEKGSPGARSAGRGTRRSRGILALTGTTQGTMADCITISPTLPAWPNAALGECPAPYTVELSPIFNSDVLNVFTEDFGLIIYEHILIASKLLLCEKRAAYEEEVYGVYAKVYHVSAEQHLRCLSNLMRPGLRRAVTSGELPLESETQHELDMHFDDVTLRELVTNSHDDGFAARMTALLHAMEQYPDEDDDATGERGDPAHAILTELDAEGNVVTPQTASLLSNRPRGRGYPLAIRATLLAGALRPMYVYNAHGKLAYNEHDIRHCLSALLRELRIPQEIVGYCHLHARLMSNNEEVAKETLHAWLRDATRAVNELSDGALAARPLTPATKYAYYVLQETLGVAMMPMPWLHSFFGTDSLCNLSAFFIESCLALPPSCLAALVRVNGRHVVPSTTSSGVYVFALLSVFLGISTISDFDALLPRLRADPGTPLEHALVRCAALDLRQRQYCALLTRSLPGAAGLVLPARMRLGSYLLLLHCGLVENDDVAGEEERRRGSAVEAWLTNLTVSLEQLRDRVHALLGYLVTGLEPPAEVGTTSCAGTVWGEGQEMTHVLRAAAAVHLRPIDVLVRRQDAALVEEVQMALRRTWTWAVSEAQCTEPHAPLLALLRRCTGAMQLAPLGADPAAIYTARLHTFVHLTTLVLDRVRVEAPAVDTTREMPLIYVQHRRLQSFYRQVTAAPVTRADVLGLLHRINTVSAVQDECETFFSGSHVQYEQVRRVTGAAAVQATEHWQSVCNCARRVKNELCERLSATLILSQPLYGTVTAQYMRTDAAVVQAMRNSVLKGHLEHYQRAFPAVTMETVLAEVQKVLADVPLIARASYRDEVYCSIGSFFAALLYGVYVEGSETLLTEYDAEGILEDLNRVRTFCVEVLHAAMTNSSSSTAILSCATTDCGGAGANGLSVTTSGTAVARHVSTLSNTFDEDMRSCFGGDSRTVPGAEHALRLCQVFRELRNIVRYVMTQKSAVLLAGGDGVPPLASLPEFKANSPWCKYIVRHVLEHRRDKAARQVSN